MLIHGKVTSTSRFSTCHPHVPMNALNCINREYSINHIGAGQFFCFFQRLRCVGLFTEVHYTSHTPFLLALKSKMEVLNLHFVTFSTISHIRNTKAVNFLTSRSKFALKGRYGGGNLLQHAKSSTSGKKAGKTYYNRWLKSAKTSHGRSLSCIRRPWVPYGGRHPSACFSHHHPWYWTLRAGQEQGAPWHPPNPHTSTPPPADLFTTNGAKQSSCTSPPWET